MNTDHKEEIYQDPSTGDTQIHRTTTQTPSDSEVSQRSGWKINQIIWLIVGIINAILVLRMVFQLLGASDTGFASVLYSITSPFVAAFRGIFTSPVNGVSYFDSAALLAIIVYSLIAWGLSALIDVLSQPSPHA